jgi:hypothetical protein
MNSGQTNLTHSGGDALCFTCRKYPLNCVARILLALMEYVIGLYEGVSKSFRTGRLEREVQLVQLSTTRCSCIAIL